MMKTDVAEEETMASYERRLLHARLAILRAELGRRAGDGSGASIVEMLPKILADEHPSSRGSFPGSDPMIPDTPSRRVTKLISDDTLANLPTLSEVQIGDHIKELEDAEREISGSRRELQDVLDKLNREIARRYASGEVDPGDSLVSRS